MRTIGIDIGKNGFHVVICDQDGKTIERLRPSRNRLMQVIAQQPPSLVGMESCAASQPLARGPDTSCGSLRPVVARRDLTIIVASTVGRMLQPRFVFDAVAAFEATVYFFQWLHRHELGEIAVAPVVDYFWHSWRDILEARRQDERAKVGFVQCGCGARTE